MDKQKQIEEIAKVVRKYYSGFSEYKVAKEIYRILIPENAVVLTREEYNRLLGQYKNLEINYNCVWEDFRRYEIENETLKQNIVVLRKETAEKFAEKLKSLFPINEDRFCFSTPEQIQKAVDEICKELLEG